MRSEPRWSKVNVNDRHRRVFEIHYQGVIHLKQAFVDPGLQVRN